MGLILELVNDLKFHEEYMKRWKVHDLRVERSILALETIYTKLYFNKVCVEVVNVFDNLKKATYYYFLEDKKMSYLISDGFNVIKGQLQNIKNIRKDSSFKLTILSFTRKAIYSFLLNLEFLAKDVDAKIELDIYPLLINSFNEIESKFDNLMRNVRDTYKLNNKYLNHFFCKDYFKKWFEKILEHLIRSYKIRLTNDIKEFFRTLDSIDNFIVTDFFEVYINQKVENSSKFAANFVSIPEQACLESLMNDLFIWIAGAYKDWADFEYDKTKSKLSEIQGKILTLRLTDSLLKMKLVKITKSFEEYFTSPENIQINAFNISFAFCFRKDFSKLIPLIRLKDYPNEKKKLSVLKFVHNSTKTYEDFENKHKEINRIFYKMRILKNITKFVNKTLNLYKNKFGDPNKKVTEDDFMDDEEEVEEEKQEEMKKPAELDELVLPCRYFPYKKKIKQNFGYIKGK